MKLLIFLSVFLVCLGFVVHSQYVDSCENNEINFNDRLNFESTAMSCQIVWEKQGFTLRYAKAGTELWSFLLSVYDPSSWFAIGFSPNGEMNGSSAMVGWIYQNGTSMALQYDLKDKDSTNVLPDKGDLILVRNSSTVFKISTRIYMGFQLRTRQPLADFSYAIGPYSLPSESNGFLLNLHRDDISTKINYTSGTGRGSKLTTGQTSAGNMNKFPMELTLLLVVLSSISSFIITM